MRFLRQIKFEIRNILKSKFLLIIGLLVLIWAIASPIVNMLTANANQYNPYYPGPIVYEDSIGIDGGTGGIIIDDPNMQTITIDGVTIDSNNPYYWQLSNSLKEIDNLETGLTTFNSPETVDVMLDLLKAETQYYLIFAKSITTYNDYRVDLAYFGIESVYDQFFLTRSDITEAVLIEVVQYRKGMDEASIRKKYINITLSEREAALTKAEDMLALYKSVVENNDFPGYITLKMQQSNDQIAAIEANIAIQEEAIAKNPDQEDSLSPIIDQMRREISVIQTGTIPVLQYRLEKNIIPGTNVWQNTALLDIEMARQQLAYNLVIISEEEFNKNGGGGGFYPLRDIAYKPIGPIGPDSQGQTYQEYVAAMQKQIDAQNKIINIAQQSLDSDQPDMKYVPAGARNQTVGFLNYSLFVALFGVLLGGWLIASEYQQGTIRLLMIRPKTRTKILLAKFTAALLICVAVFIVGTLLNIVVNGICFGFGDFAFPNYTTAGAVNFFAFYIPQLLACMVPIVFAFTLAFMLSVLIKNTAVAIAVPIAFFIGSMVLMVDFAYNTTMSWLAWTPFPFIWMSDFFQLNSNIQYAINNGVSVSLFYGIGLLLGLAVIFSVTSVLVFKKRDIAN